jgi:GT2 family glycosyltransferase
MIGLVVPVLSNFRGLTELMHSVDTDLKPIVIDNYKQNRGVAAGWNLGIDIARMYGCTTAIVANDDIVFYPGTIRKLHRAVQGGYDVASAVNRRDFAEGEGADWAIDYSCFAVNPETFFDKFGRFDENFKPAYFEDNDMHRRVTLLGGKSVNLIDAPMYHAGSVTQLAGTNDPDTPNRVVSHHQFRLNRDYYQAKWGGWPGEEKFDTPFNLGGSLKVW